MVTADDVRSVALTLPRTEERLVRDRVKFRVGQIVYVAISADETSMGFGFPKEERAALVAAEPDKFFMPVRSDERYHWARVWLAAIDATEMRELVVDAWRMVVPKRVAAAYDRLSGMAGKRSAGILLFGRSGTQVEVLLGHMGGPFWAMRDHGAWSVPKGEYEPAEDPLAAAHREFEEELGLPVPAGELVELGAVRQSGGKIVTVWALEGDLDPSRVVPGTFEMEWPPASGVIQEFPEIDRVEWFGLDEARDKIVGGQRVFIDRLVESLRA